VHTPLRWTHQVGELNDLTRDFYYLLTLHYIGNLYIVDDASSVIRKVVASTGIISTIAGTGSNGFSGDGGQATAATFRDPEGLTVDSSGIPLLSASPLLTFDFFLFPQATYSSLICIIAVSAR
jgi:hypothetical protein